MFTIRSNMNKIKYIINTKTNKKWFSAKKDSKQHQQDVSDNNSRTAYYMAAFTVFTFGAAYASVPLYKVFCQVKIYPNCINSVFTATTLCFHE